MDGVRVADRVTSCVYYSSQLVIECTKPRNHAAWFALLLTEFLLENSRVLLSCALKLDFYFNELNLKAIHAPSNAAE